MDDEICSPSLNGVPGYALGRTSAENERALGDFGKILQRHLRPATSTVDVDALLIENEMLRRQLAFSEADLNELEGIYARLKSWAKQASQLLNKHGLIEK